MLTNNIIWPFRIYFLWFSGFLFQIELDAMQKPFSRVEFWGILELLFFFFYLGLEFSYYCDLIIQAYITKLNI